MDGRWTVDCGLWIGGKGVEVEVVRGDEGALLGSGAAATRWFDGKAVAVSESFLPSCFPSSYEQPKVEAGVGCAGRGTFLLGRDCVRPTDGLECGPCCSGSVVLCMYSPVTAGS